MAVIDTSQIAGFDTMTAEQQRDALLKFEIPESVDLSNFVSKETFDKKATEAASLSRQLRERMSDDELKKADKEKEISEIRAQLEAMKAENGTLQKTITIAEYTAKYLALGYDAELAKDTAKAMADGDMDRVFKNGETHKAALERRIKEDLMNKTPKPGGSSGDDKGVDPAVAKARELAKAKQGNDKAYAEIMSKYK